MPKRGTASDRKAACRRRMPRSGKNCCGSNKDNAAAGGGKAHGVCCPGRDETFRKESFKVFCPTFCTLQKVGKSGEAAKGFNFVCTNLLFWCADSRFAKPRSSLKKVLIVAVRRCHCGGLLRGLENLEAFRKGNELSLFASCKK